MRRKGRTTHFAIGPQQVTVIAGQKPNAENSCVPQEKGESWKGSPTILRDRA